MSAAAGRSLRRGLVVSVFLLAIGCGKGTISGKVTYKDKPLTGGKVVFTTEKGKAVEGPIDDDGNYTVKGVPTGTARVTVLPNEAPKLAPGGGPPGRPGAGGPPKDRMLGPPKDTPMPDDVRKKFESFNKPGGSDPALKDFPAKYKTPDESGLTLDVKSGEQEYNIPLGK
jgi:hypothetical protein